MSHELLKQKWCRLVCDFLLGKTFPHYSSSGIHKKDRKLWIASGFLSIPNDIEVTPQLGPNYSLQVSIGHLQRAQPLLVEILQ